jgi:thiamine biosynthesis lipoprotein
MNLWRTLRFDFTAMASPCSLQLDGCDEGLMRRAAASAIVEVHRIEKKFSRYQPDSIVSRINQAAGLQAVEVDDETDGLLTFCDSLWRMSEGAFDITSGVLRHAWDFKASTLPDPVHLENLLARVGWQGVKRQGHHVGLTQAGMELDLGGIGKEYAADCAAAVLHRHGVTHALVNLGGDLHALGERGLPELQGASWHINIQHPRPAPDAPTKPLAQLALSRGGLATSGDYERFFIHAGQRYCHVLDPRTGWPVSHWQSVSVLATNTTTAGALATIAMLKGDGATAWLSSQGVRYLAVQADGQVLSHASCCPVPEPSNSFVLPSP